jgi:lipoyl(octanoyl) transferase
VGAHGYHPPTRFTHDTALIRILPFARVDYAECLEAMRAFTAARDAGTPDEIWLVEHPPVFTLGLAGKAEHVLTPGEIPVVRTERGGQVTYHGPGQVVAYTLIDLHRRKLTVRGLVCRIEDAVIATCAGYGVRAVRRSGAPGVYIADADTDSDARDSSGAKVASLGLKVSRGCSFHGVALNVAMDLAPFGRINPCGYAGQAVTDLAREAGDRVGVTMTGPGPDHGLAAPHGHKTLDAVARRFAAALVEAIERP